MEPIAEDGDEDSEQDLAPKEPSANGGAPSVCRPQDHMVSHWEDPHKAGGSLVSAKAGHIGVTMRNIQLDESSLGCSGGVSVLTWSVSENLLILLLILVIVTNNIRTLP